ncbi:MAG: HEAT repeat domain-containing protein [Myxococcaceae bacterium]|nr:HEAT repeat domain-containing protein [Myxococcaceae bacterium]
MIDHRPEVLLKSALEKIVYFEARSEQLGRDLEAARAEVDRLRLDVSSAAQREIELRRMVAELEVRASRAHAEREEIARVADALRRERADLIGKMLEASQIHGAGDSAGAAEAFDLARFISELRSAVITSAPVPTHRLPVARAEPVALVAAEETPAQRTAKEVTAVAQAFKESGRLSVQPAEVHALEAGYAFPGRTEETLFGFSVRELSAPDVPSRLRASERLLALGHPAAAPALAAALHGETEPQVLVSLLNTFAALAKSEGVAVVSPLLSSTHADVRIAALKALLMLDAACGGPHLAAAIKDPDRAVRRRASLLALGLKGDEALSLGEQAIHDPDVEVRSLAALVLGASGAEQARALLLGAMRDKEIKVRRAAAQSMSRLLGHDVSNVVDMEDAQRRREVRRMASLPSKPVLGKAVTAPVHAVAHGAAVKTGQKVAVLEVAAPPRREVAVTEVLCGQIITELRAAIRGKPLGDLATAVHETPEVVARACALLESRGQAVRRGAKFFVA